MKSLVRAVVEMLIPLRLAATDPGSLQALLRDLGWPDAPDDLTIGAVEPLAAVLNLISTVEALASTLDDATGSGAAQALVSAIEAIDAVMAAIDDLRNWDPGTLVPADLWYGTSPTDLAVNLPGLLVSRWLELRAPAIQALLLLSGVIVEESFSRPVGPPLRRIRVNWDLLATAVADPEAAVATHHGWAPGSPWRHPHFVEYSRRLALGIGITARLEPVDDRFIGAHQGALFGHRTETLDVREVAVPIISGASRSATATGFAEIGLLLVPAPTSPGGEIDSLVVSNLTYGDASASMDAGGGWTLAMASTLDATGALQVRLEPGNPPSIAGVPVDSDLALTLTSPPLDCVILGDLDGTCLAIGALEVSIEVTPTPRPDIKAEVRLVAGDAVPHGVQVTIDPGEGDSFLAAALGTIAIDAGFDIGFEWSASAGFGVAAGSAITFTIPLGLTIGPVTLFDLEVAISIGDGGMGGGSIVRVDVGASLGASLGVISMSVDGLGLAASLVGAGDAALVRIGDLGISVAFKPPDGIGIGIDVGVVSGGGYLDIDAEAGTYEGIVDIDVLGIGVSAVVIIETDAPGVDGWSMFFALFIGLPSIQLGFGFTLTGVGGVAGINRTLDPEALGAAVRSGSLDAVLFPDEPIAQAPLIIDTFKAIFPAENDRVVFGPIVRIAWGTPTLVEAELGIVLSLPDPIVIAVIGSVTAILPTPDVDLVAINLDIGGVIDFEAMSLTLSASLHDSHVVGFALSGDMELRANFGSQPSFLMSLGGFHPDFVPPAGFPSLNRLRLALSSNPYFNISFECYLALTSNTVQFGAALDIDAEIAGFGIAGGASFDALVQFTPFMLRTDLGFYITVTAAGIDLAGVWLDVSVDGPNPWSVDGVARFQILGFEEQIDVHEIIGTARDEPSVAEVDPFASIIAALSSPDAWTVVSSPSGLGVTLASSPPAEGVLLASPESTLAVGQRVAPLGIDLDHIGNAPIGEHTRFEVEARPRGIPSTGTTVDWFAPANYFDLSPIEAVSGPSFEQLTNGITLGGGAPTAGTAVESSLEYEQILRDPEMGIDSLTLGTYHPLADVRPLAATAHSSFATSSSYAAAMDDTASLADAEYTVVDAITGLEVSTNTTMNFTTPTFTTWSSAHAVAAASVGARTVITPTWELAS